ncbi:MFS polyamine transporter [Mycena filopes]|nr:MFS polyamine transporter [Mycena filopes]
MVLQSGNRDTEDGVSEAGEIQVVDWNGPNDPENPQNWTYAQKWVATGIISTYTMLSPITSSIIAPAAPRVAHDLDAHGSVFQPLLTSIFILAYAFGPLFFGPASQIFGRSRVVQLGNIFYIAFNIACGFAKRPSQILAWRFLAGIGGSAPLVIGGGVINDCWSVKQRGRAVTLYALAPLLGPIIGPVAGAWIATRTKWQWVFWSTTIAAVLVQAIAFIWLKETFAPIILKRKARKLAKNHPDSKYLTSFEADPKPFVGGSKAVRIFAYHYSSKPSRLKQLLYPIKLIFTEPTAQVLGVYLAYIYGMHPPMMILTSIPGIYVSVYHEGIGIAGLHYLAFGLGLYGGAQICNALLDKIHAALAERYKDAGRPEYRLPIMLPATILVPIGLLITGWTARSNVHWIAPDIGLVLTGIGIAINYQSIQTYIIDTYTVRAAPALGGLSLLRSLVGFALPLASPAMYRNLGYGVGNTILAACAIVLGLSMVTILWFWGELLRNNSATAHKPPVKGI